MSEDAGAADAGGDEASETGYTGDDDAQAADDAQAQQDADDAAAQQQADEQAQQDQEEQDRQQQQQREQCPTCGRAKGIPPPPPPKKKVKLPNVGLAGILPPSDEHVWDASSPDWSGESVGM